MALERAAGVGVERAAGVGAGLQEEVPLDAPRVTTSLESTYILHIRIYTYIYKYAHVYIDT